MIRPSFRRNGMNSQQPQHPVQMSLELPADLEAIYANFAVITHSPSEVIVDFARMLPGTPKSRVHARIVMTPMNAKALLRALTENLEALREAAWPDQAAGPAGRPTSRWGLPDDEPGIARFSLGKPVPTSPRCPTWTASPPEFARASPPRTPFVTAF